MEVREETFDDGEGDTMGRVDATPELLNNLVQFVNKVIPVPKKINANFVRQNEESKQMIAFFNLHLGISLKTDFWTKVQSTATFVSVLGLRWLEMKNHVTLANKLTEKNLPHPLPYIYEHARTENEDGDVVDYIVPIENGNGLSMSLKSAYESLVFSYNRQEQFADIEFLEWSTVSSRLNLYRECMSAFVNAHQVYQLESPRHLQATVGQIFRNVYKREKARESGISPYEKRFKKTLFQLIKKVAKQSREAYSNLLDEEADVEEQEERERKKIQREKLAKKKREQRRKAKLGKDCNDDQMDTESENDDDEMEMEERNVDGVHGDETTDSVRRSSRLEQLRENQELSETTDGNDSLEDTNDLPHGLRLTTASDSSIEQFSEEEDDDSSTGSTGSIQLNVTLQREREIAAALAEAQLNNNGNSRQHRSGKGNSRGGGKRKKDDLVGLRVPETSPATEGTNGNDTNQRKKKRPRKKDTSNTDENDSEIPDSKVSCDIMLLSSKDQKYLLVPRSIFEQNNHEEGPVMVVEMYVDSEGHPVAGPGGSTFEITKANTKNGPVRLAEMLFLQCSPEYFQLIADLDFYPHSVISREEVDRLMKQNKALGYPVRMNTDGLTGGPNSLPRKTEEELYRTAYCVAAGTKEYETSAFGKLQLDIGFWIDRFLAMDEANLDQLRNVRTMDVGFSGRRKKETHVQTQAEDPANLMSRPALIQPNDKELYRNVGPVLEALSEEAFQHARKKRGGRVMEDTLLDESFAKVFRQKCGDEYTFKWHAATIAFQLAGEVVDMEGHPFSKEQIEEALSGKEGAKIMYAFKVMCKHKDGANMSRDGFQFTGIWSILVLVGSKVYRLTFIAYTRKICDSWLQEKMNYMTDILNNMAEYKHKYNGDIAFEDFYLTDNNDHMEVWKDGSGDNGHTRLAPPQMSPPAGTKVIKGYSYRVFDPWKKKTNPDGRKESNTKTGKKCKRRPLPLKPLEHQYPKPGDEGYEAYLKDLVDFAIEYINVREFICRSAYDSGKAWCMNTLADKEQLKRRNLVELLWAALVVNSPITFATVLTFWKLGKRVPGRGFSFNDPAVRLMDEFEATALFLDQEPLGGVCTRWTSAGADSWPTTNWVQNKSTKEWSGTRLTDIEYENELDIIKKGLTDLESGHLQDEGVMGPMGLRGLSEVTSLSFPSLAIFTQLVNTMTNHGDDKETNTKANCCINRAITAEINMTHVDTFWTKYVKNAGSIEKPPKSKWKSIFVALGDKFGSGRPGDIENFFCSDNRTQMKGDVFFKGQDLYIISGRKAMIKQFGSKVWRDLEEVRLEQRKIAGCPIHQYTK